MWDIGLTAQLHSEQRQLMIPSARLLRLLSLLPLPAHELSAHLDRAIQDNPMLERAPGSPCVSCGRHCLDIRCRDCGTTERPQEITARVDWREELATSARAELPSSAHSLLDFVLGSIDEHGLLIDLDQRAAPSDALAQVIEVIQRVGPPGLAATSRTECLRRQVIRGIAHGELPEILLAIVDAHLDDVAADRLAVIAQDLEVPVADVSDAVTLLRTKVRPYVVLDDPSPVEPAPDVIFRRGLDDADTLIAEVTDARWFGIQVSEDLWRTADREGRAWLRPLRLEAVRLLSSVNARASMLRRLAEFLAVAQRDFILAGPAAHRRLNRSDAATELGVHPSTIGRAIEGKAARCPNGAVVAMSGFFGGRTSVLERLRELVAENPGATDAQLQDLLAEEGTAIARRTVAKYRGLLGLAPGGAKVGSPRQ